jgi:hypothetical protein
MRESEHRPRQPVGPRLSTQTKLSPAAILNGCPGTRMRASMLDASAVPPTSSSAATTTDPATRPMGSLPRPQPKGSYSGTSQTTPSGGSVTSAEYG